MNENQLRPICEVLAQMTTGSNISYMLLSLGISCDLDDNATKWRRIYNAIVINWNKFHTNDMLIKIIEWIMSPALYIDKQERFNEGRDALNQRLSFLGLELLSNGKIQSRPVATTLDEANQTINKLKRDLQRFDIHPQILTFCRPEIINEDLFHLIFEASKCLLYVNRYLHPTFFKNSFLSTWITNPFTVTPKLLLFDFQILANFASQIAKKYPLPVILTD